jgi:hypothetical protein
VQPERDETVVGGPQQQGRGERRFRIRGGHEFDDPLLQAGAVLGAGLGDFVAAFKQQLVRTGIGQAPADVGLAGDHQRVASGRAGDGLLDAVDEVGVLRVQHGRAQVGFGREVPVHRGGRHVALAGD